MLVRLSDDYKNVCRMKSIIFMVMIFGCSVYGSRVGIYNYVGTNIVFGPFVIPPGYQVVRVTNGVYDIYGVGEPKTLSVTNDVTLQAGDNGFCQVDESDSPFRSFLYGFSCACLLAGFRWSLRLTRKAVHAGIGE
jgi:hypothetical protein